MVCPRCRLENPDDSKFCKECGTALHRDDESPFSPTVTFETPFRVLGKGSLFAGRYRIDGEIGRGGMGVVFKAEDSKLKRAVALKLLPSELGRIPEAKERFIREAQAAAALDHANICTIYESEEHEGQAYIAMAYVDGESLRQRIVRGPLPVEDAVEMAVQIAEGLAEAHKKGIIHRDVKSANIMITEKGQAKIMDFGLAKVSGESRITKEGRTMGTVAYMSPEQARGEAVDHRTDIWSLGVVLYEMVSGELPFGGAREASILYSIAHEEPRSLKELKPPVPGQLRRIMGRALKKSLEARYASAAEMLGDLKKCREAFRAEASGVVKPGILFKRLRNPRVAVPAAAAMTALLLFSVLFFARRAKIRWAKESALPEIARLIESGWSNYAAAYALAQKAEKYVPREPQLQAALARCGMRISVATEPPGASIFFKEYQAPESDWAFLGVSPLEDVRMPFGFFRWKLEKEGYEPAAAVFSTFDWVVDKPSLIGPAKIFKTLDKKGVVPAGKVRVTGGEAGGFLLDEYEVTNREFKAFVDRGGYQTKDYWKHPFLREGKNLPWEDAVKEFVDSTGLPGPSTWEGGSYPEGQDEHPVSGVSWYEAAAYAEFSGGSLPSVRQWEMGAGLNVPTISGGGFFLPLVATMSKFGGTGPDPVGSHPGITTHGAYDMAGNVREWCRDEADKGRCLRGGAWNDAPYMFIVVSQAPSFDRSPRNGFRCVREPEAGKTFSAADPPLRYRGSRNFYEQKPVAESVFQVYREQFFYDRTDLEPRLEARDESRDDWIKEKAGFRAAYENEWMSVYLFLPKNAVPPYQTVIHVPGSQAVFLSSSEGLESSEYFRYFCEFIVRSGRALVHPVYKGTYERGDSAVYVPLHLGNDTRQYAEFLAKLVKDFRRSVDFLETRDDVDVHKLAYYGLSWGAAMGAIIPAVEERLTTSILLVGGFFVPDLRPGSVRPEADEINYVTRVRIPTLMLNGKYDYHAFPLETSAKPLFDLLGTPPSEKQQIFYDSDHTPPRSEFVRDILAWLDRTLGPVERRNEGP